MIRKNSIALLLMVAVATLGYAQKKDTVIVELAKSSKMVLIIDRTDLETLKYYDFQKLFQDVTTKLEKNDSSIVIKRDSVKTKIADISDNDDNILQLPEHQDKKDEEDEKSKNKKWYGWKNEHRWQRQSFRVDLGTNNFLSNGKFPDESNAAYGVRPWGSWYVGLNSIHRTRVAKKIFLEWGGGVSWYNFKFQNKNTLIQKTDDEVNFGPDTRGFDYLKSKLTATYLNASFVPVFDLGDHGKSGSWNKNAFRIGVGPYVGYRIASHSKLVYNKDNHTEKEKNKDNFYLNNIRYGARLQVGFMHTDLFFNYDLNELFSSNKGPDLNAFSFGIVF